MNEWKQEKKKERDVRDGFSDSGKNEKEIRGKR